MLSQVHLTHTALPQSIENAIATEAQPAPLTGHQFHCLVVGQESFRDQRCNKFIAGLSLTILLEKERKRLLPDQRRLADEIQDILSGFRSQHKGKAIYIIQSMPPHLLT